MINLSMMIISTKMMVLLFNMDSREKFEISEKSIFCKITVFLIQKTIIFTNKKG